MRYLMFLLLSLSLTACSGNDEVASTAENAVSDEKVLQGFTTDRKGPLNLVVINGTESMEKEAAAIQQGSRGLLNKTTSIQDADDKTMEALGVTEAPAILIIDDETVVHRTETLEGVREFLAEQ